MFLDFQALGNPVAGGLASPVLSSAVILSGVTSSPLVVSGSQLRPVAVSPKPVMLKRDISIGNIVTADGTTTFKLASQGGVTQTTPTTATSPSPRLPNIIRSSQQMGNFFLRFFQQLIFPNSAHISALQQRAQLGFS